MVLIKSPIFVPFSPIFSFARASNQRSNGVVDFALSKATKGRSPILPYFFFGSFARPVGSEATSDEAVGSGVGESAFVAGKRAGEDEESRNNASSFSRATGGKSSFFNSVSRSAR